MAEFIEFNLKSQWRKAAAAATSILCYYIIEKEAQGAQMLT